MPSFYDNLSWPTKLYTVMACLVGCVEFIAFLQLDRVFVGGGHGYNSKYPNKFIHPLDPTTFRSFHDDDTSEQLQQGLIMMATWVGIQKLLYCVVLFSSAISTDYKSRAIASIGIALSYLCCFISFFDQQVKLRDMGEIKHSKIVLYNVVFTLYFVLFGLAGFQEVITWKLQQQQEIAEKEAAGVDDVEAGIVTKKKNVRFDNKGNDTDEDNEEEPVDYYANSTTMMENNIMDLHERLQELQQQYNIHQAQQRQYHEKQKQQMKQNHHHQKQQEQQVILKGVVPQFKEQKKYQSSSSAPKTKQQQDVVVDTNNSFSKNDETTTTSGKTQVHRNTTNNIFQ